jgi:UDP-3-O-[3-hydroxymyristoyl] N-acetylglucosamine deacetylase
MPSGILLAGKATGALRRRRPGNMVYRRTLRREVACTGIGLHSGRPVRLRLLPAPAEHGIRFARTDVGVEIPATLGHIGGQDHATTLRRDGVSIGTVEHLLAALYGMGVDDVRVEVEGPEVPVLDGSAAPFVILLHEAGLRPLAAPRLHLRVREAVEVVHGAKSARLVPCDHFEIGYSIGFDHPLLRHQALSLRVTPRSFTEALAPARTFGFLREVEMLRKSGLALGGSLENAVVIGETGVLNNKLRFDDEFVRHKILDAVGDLALLGHPLLGRLEATRAGHALHAAVAQKLLATAGAWELVPAGAPALEAAPAAALQPAGA